MIVMLPGVSAQDAAVVNRQKFAVANSGKPVAVLATEEEKMEVAAAIDHVLFDFDRATISPDFYPKLKGLAAWLNDKAVTLRVLGYADSIGSEQYNFRLSERRAKAVKAYLVAIGVKQGLIEPEGLGEENPSPGSNSEAGRRKSRRVEFSLY